MKLIIAGATGYLGTELVRQALAHPVVTQVIALARRPTTAPHGLPALADVSKLKSIVCEDFSNYSSDVLEQFSAADACIWTIAVTPPKALSTTPEKVREVTFDYTATALATFIDTRQGTEKPPLRFVYASGSKVVRENPSRSFIFGDYGIIRADTEIKVMSTAKENSACIEACCARFGLITWPENTPWLKKAALTGASKALGLGMIDLRAAAGAALSLALNGNFDRDPYLNKDLIEIGNRALLIENGP